jgi:cytochrome c-type biogenesis protein CcmH/NrfF
MGSGGYIHTTPRHVVFMAECRSCDSQREIDRDALEKAAEGMGTIREIEARLRCSVCQEKNAELLTGYYVEDEP